MDRYGCAMIWVCSAEPGHAGDLSCQNDVVLRFARRYPDRVVPYCTLSANEPERALPELHRCMQEAPCIGVKMHRYGQPLTGFTF